MLRAADRSDVPPALSTNFRALDDADDETRTATRDDATNTP